MSEVISSEVFTTHPAVKNRSFLEHMASRMMGVIRHD